jgi:hypothetical protein
MTVHPFYHEYMRTAIILLLAIVFHLETNCQTTDSKLEEKYNKASGIKIPDSKQTIENISCLGMIWELMKYYHPEIRKGKCNWDFELFEILPKMYGRTVAQRDSILVNWIRKFGVIDTISEGEKLIVEYRIQPDCHQ